MIYLYIELDVKKWIQLKASTKLLDIFSYLLKRHAPKSVFVLISISPSSLTSALNSPNFSFLANLPSYWWDSVLKVKALPFLIYFPLTVYLPLSVSPALTISMISNEPSAFKSNLVLIP